MANRPPTTKLPKVKRAKGDLAWDEDENQYIDFCQNSGSLFLGHQHPSVVDALKQQISQLTSNPAGSANNLLDRFCEEIEKFFPTNYKCHVTTTGSEASAHSLRLCRFLTGRQHVLKIKRAYHGNHDLSMIDLGSNGIDHFAKDIYHSIDWNNLEQAKEALETEKFAAVFIEPVLRVFPAEENFLIGLRDLCKKHGTLLIFDEVVTGWRFMNGPSSFSKKVTADITCLGKIIGGGLPLAAIVADEKLINEFQSKKVYSSGTHFANPLALACGLSTLEELKHKDYDKLNELSQSFFAEIESSIQRSGRSIHLLIYKSMFKLSFSERCPKDPEELICWNQAQDIAFDLELLSKGILVNPGKRHFITFGHQQENLEKAVKVFSDLIENPTDEPKD